MIRKPTTRTTPPPAPSLLSHHASPEVAAQSMSLLESACTSPLEEVDALLQSLKGMLPAAPFLSVRSIVGDRAYLRVCTKIRKRTDRVFNSLTPPSRRAALGRLAGYLLPGAIVIESAPAPGPVEVPKGWKHDCSLGHWIPEKKRRDQVSALLKHYHLTKSAAKEEMLKTEIEASLPPELLAVIRTCGWHVTDFKDVPSFEVAKVVVSLIHWSKRDEANLEDIRGAIPRVLRGDYTLRRFFGDEPFSNLLEGCPLAEDLHAL
jgi:hypothetical protein